MKKDILDSFIVINDIIVKNEDVIVKLNNLNYDDKELVNIFKGVSKIESFDEYIPDTKELSVLSIDVNGDFVLYTDVLYADLKAYYPIIINDTLIKDMLFYNVDLYSALYYRELFINVVSILMNDDLKQDKLKKLTALNFGVDNFSSVKKAKQKIKTQEEEVLITFVNKDDSTIWVDELSIPSLNIEDDLDMVFKINNILVTDNLSSIITLLNDSLDLLDTKTKDNLIESKNIRIDKIKTHEDEASENKKAKEDMVKSGIKLEETKKELAETKKVLLESEKNLEKEIKNREARMAEDDDGYIDNPLYGLVYNVPERVIRVTPNYG